MVLKGQILLRQNGRSANGVQANKHILFGRQVDYVVVSWDFHTKHVTIFVAQETTIETYKMDHAICNSFISIKAYSIFCHTARSLIHVQRWQSIKIYKKNLCLQVYNLLYSQEWMCGRLIPTGACALGSKESEREM